MKLLVLFLQIFFINFIIQSNCMLPKESYKQFLRKRTNKFNPATDVCYVKELDNNLVLVTTVRCNLFPWENTVSYSGLKKIIDKDALISDQASFSTLKFSLRDIKNFTCFLNTMNTHEEHRNKGYSTLLLHDLEIELKETNCSRIHVMTSIAALSFYKKRGFKGKKEYAYSEMIKELQEKRS